MAATPFQSGILRLLAARRRAQGESYVAGGVALNQLLLAPRRSRDIDLFHDTAESLAATWADDRAYRFFPLIEDDIMGLVLHPFDLATNKVLAMAGRLEPRDWIDVISCDERIQPFGYLVWAACGKDPGFNPNSLLAAASRAHYSHAEINALDFDGPWPDAVVLGTRWHEILRVARQIGEHLPAEEAGKCVITTARELFRGGVDELDKALRDKAIVFHEGRIGGSWPTIKG